MSMALFQKWTLKPSPEIESALSRLVTSHLDMDLCGLSKVNQSIEFGAIHARTTDKTMEDPYFRRHNQYR